MKDKKLYNIIYIFLKILYCLIGVIIISLLNEIGYKMTFMQYMSIWIMLVIIIKLLQSKMKKYF
jgi:hypothetical protein